MRPQCHSPRQDAGDLAHSALFVNVATPQAPRGRTLIEPTPRVAIEPQSPPVPPRADNLSDLRDGLTQDDDREAAHRYKLAADQGEASAQYNLGVFYSTGRGGLAKDDREAARLYKLAADQGEAAAQNNLGYFYWAGRGGLAKDDREAARLYKLAADQGHAFAQTNLGFFYENGRGGLPKDDREAARLYKLAADQGDAAAQSISGSSTRRAVAACRRTIARPRAFTSSPPTRETPRRRPISGSSTARPWRPAEGRPRGRAPLQARRRPRRRRGAVQSRGVLRAGRGGLAKDDREAARLYKLAADQGDAAAQNNLGVFYADGPWRPAEGRSRGRAPLQARRRPGKRRGAEQSRGLLRDRPWRPAEGRSRGRAPL